jgi:hypothetical protein
LIDPDEAIRIRVEDALKKPAALEGSGIAPDPQQHKRDGLQQRSRAIRMLRELFDAIGNDSFVIAETLVYNRSPSGSLGSRYATIVSTARYVEWVHAKRALCAALTA